MGSRTIRKRTCLFGTSADPPTGTGGHLGIVTHLASMESNNNSGDCLFDEVRVLPVYSHMFEVGVACFISIVLTLLIFVPVTLIDCCLLCHKSSLS
jgi:hypothetical protein